MTAAAQHEGDGQKRFALAFDTGDEVLASLQEFAARERLSAAQFSAIAAFSSAILGYFAPALAAAEVGIAMGTGTYVTIESAGITLLKGDLMGIVKARRLSQATMSNIRQNLFFVFLDNAAGVPIAAGVLYPTFGILLSPIIARRPWRSPR